MLGYRDDSFWALDISVYADMIAGTIEYNLESEDRLLQRMAYMFATVAMSSGNYKKNTKGQDIVDSMYSPLLQQLHPDKSVAPERPELNKDEAASFVANMEKQMNMM